MAMLACSQVQDPSHVSGWEGLHLLVLVASRVAVVSYYEIVLCVPGRELALQISHIVCRPFDTCKDGSCSDPRVVSALFLNLAQDPHGSAGFCQFASGAQVEGEGGGISVQGRAPER